MLADIYTARWPFGQNFTPRGKWCWGILYVLLSIWSMEGAWDISLDTLETSFSMQNMNKWTLGGLNGIYAVLSLSSAFYIISLPAPTNFPTCSKYWPGDGLGEGPFHFRPFPFRHSFPFHLAFPFRPCSSQAFGHWGRHAMVLDLVSDLVLVLVWQRCHHVRRGGRGQPGGTAWWQLDSRCWILQSFNYNT